MSRVLPALLALALASALAPAATAQHAGRRMLTDEEAAAFHGVGRLNVAGTRFCTATLISERLAVTAAHCLHHPRTGRRLQLGELRFVAGLRRDAYAALRRIAAVAVPPDFVFEEGPDLVGVRADVALLALEAPIPAADATAFTPGPPPAEGAAVAIVSYGRDRAQAASIQESCRVPQVAGAVAAVSCAVNFGASGAPVFTGAGEARRLVAVVSAKGKLTGEGQVTFAVLLAPRLAELEAMLGANR